MLDLENEAIHRDRSRLEQENKSPQKKKISSNEIDDIEEWDFSQFHSFFAKLIAAVSKL